MARPAAPAGLPGPRCAQSGIQLTAVLSRQVPLPPGRVPNSRRTATEVEPPCGPGVPAPRTCKAVTIFLSLSATCTGMVHAATSFCDLPLSRSHAERQHPCQQEGVVGAAPQPVSQLARGEQRSAKETKTGQAVERPALMSGKMRSSALPRAGTCSGAEQGGTGTAETR